MKSIIKVFWSDRFSLNGKIFNILGLAGVTTSLLMFIGSLVTGGTVNDLLLNAGLLFFSAIIVAIHVITKNYSLCSTMTIVGIFLVAFPLIYFSSDGYTGGMPSFFVFAIVFTIYLVKGKPLVVIVLLEFLTNIFLCFYSYYNPEIIAHHRSEYDLMIDIVSGFVLVSLILGITMYIQFKMYVRQQKQLERARAEAERANKAKNSFLANMSHEIRTPIGIILGTNEIIARNSGHTAQLKEQVERIKHAGELLDALLNNVLDYAKIEAGKSDLVIDTYRLSVLLTEIEQYGRTLAKKKDLEFSLFTDGNMNDYYRGDALAIKQILLNIINNAVKYTEKGAITLQVSQKEANVDNEVTLHFVISDTGIGINQENVDEIFDSFKRIDRNKGNYIEGVGLGLSIVKQLLTLMNADIEVVSILGQGSDFKVYIPQEVVLDVSVDQAEQIPKTFIAPSVNVLIVDDNFENLTLIASLLERTLINVDTAQNTNDCLRLIDEKAYDVLLLDYMMPDMNGIDLLKLIRQNQNFSAPVVAVTADAASETKDLLLKSGFDSYMTKPVSWQELEDNIVRFLPKEKYKLIDIPQNRNNDNEFNNVLSIKDRLAEYGIDCETAIFYAGHSSELFYKSVLIFVRYVGKEIDEAVNLLENRDFESLYYIIHSLKSKAKSIGANQLHMMASELEQLAKFGKVEELSARMHYLIFLWRNAQKGMIMIQEKLSSNSEK